MANVYSNGVIEDLIWSAIEESHCAQDFLDFIAQFPDTQSTYWQQALERAVVNFSPADPKGLLQKRFSEGVFELIEQLAQDTNSDAIRAIAHFRLGKMLHSGFGVEKNRELSINHYKRAIALGEIRALINCGGHYDGPDATAEDLAFAHTLYERALAQGEPMGLVRMAGRIENENDPRKYELYLQAAEMGLPYGLYKVGAAHYFGKCGQPEDESLGLSWLQRAARAGSTDACEILGYHYDRRSSKEPELAWEWQMQGAKLGSPSAMYAVGLKLLLGIDRDVDTQAAMNWLFKAAVLGEERAQYRIGTQYQISEDPADHPQAVAWLKLAADSGHEYSAWRLSIAYRDGMGCEPNPKEAARYCEIAARAGFPQAQGQMGLFYWYGNGVEKDEHKAYQWLQMCALQGEAHGTYLLGLATDNGVGCTPDISEAVRLYEEAAEKGDLDAVNQLGDCYYFGHGKPKDPVQAASWYQRAASKGHARSMTDLGRMLSDGEGVITNYEEAFKWFQKAADLDEPCAMYMLAVLYANGDGVEESAEQCRRWMARAAGLGYKPAKKWMEENLPATPQWLEKLVQEASQAKSADAISTTNATKPANTDKPAEQQPNE